MLSGTGLNPFYYVRDLTESVVNIVGGDYDENSFTASHVMEMSLLFMLCNCRIVRMYSFDNRSYNLFEKEFVAGYQFMKVERNGADIFYCIDWKYVVLILENFVVKMLKSNN